MLLDDEDGEQDPEQIPFADPSFSAMDAGWCTTCQSRDRLKANCLFRDHGGDGQAYRKICTCRPGGYCYLHQRWS